MPEVIDPKDIDELIRFHQDGLADHHQCMNLFGIDMEKQTITALQHHRNLIVTTPDCQKSAVNPNV
ncbi:hypothetical protein ES708_14388 [subsurface metagenome]